MRDSSAVRTKIMRSEERGRANHGWLDARHSFSFASYYNPEAMGFRDLRVINDDRIAGGGGFSTHGHRDMEIVTYVVSGALEHRDTMGNSGIIQAGEVQKMSAGTGVRHSEFNASEKDPVHLFQIWIIPDKENHEPSYGQRSFVEELQKQDIVVLASRDGEQGSLKINQDAKILAGQWKDKKELSIPAQAERFYWLHVVDGDLSVEGQSLKTGDAIRITGADKIDLSTQSKAEFLLFDLN